MKTKKVLILHGYEGSDYPHWQDWLAKKLVKLHYEVRFSTLPNKNCPILDEWLSYLEKELQAFEPDIVVGHSLGNILWFHALQKLDVKDIDKLVLVAPVRKNCDIKEIKTFFPYKIPKSLRAKQSLLIVSNNDQYINLEEANELKKALDINMIVLENAGHINPKSGYTKLDEVLQYIIEK